MGNSACLGCRERKCIGTTTWCNNNTSATQKLLTGNDIDEQYYGFTVMPVQGSHGTEPGPSLYSSTANQFDLDAAIASLFGINHYYDCYRYTETIINECTALFTLGGSTVFIDIIKTVLAGMVQGHFEGKTTRQCFDLIRQVILCDVKASALNTTFTFAFSKHLFENRVDIFSVRSGPARLFGGLLEHILQRSTLRHSAGAANMTSSPEIHFDNVGFSRLQQIASAIINRESYSSLERGSTEAAEDGDPIQARNELPPGENHDTILFESDVNDQFMRSFYIA